MKYLIFSPQSDYGKEEKEFNLLEALQKKIKIDICFLVAKNNDGEDRKYNLRNLKKIFKKKKFHYIFNFYTLFFYIIRYNVVIISSLRIPEKYLKIIKFLNIKIVFLETSFNFDIDKSRSVYNKILTKGKITKSFFQGQNNIVPVGCTEAKLFKKSLKKKKSCIFFSTSPQHLTDWHYNLYFNTLRILKQNKIRVYIKLHPTFNNSSKFEHLDINIKKNIKKFESLVKKFKVVNQDQYHKTLRGVSFCISSQTNAFLESNYFNKPFIFVERQNFYVRNFLYLEKNREKIGFYKFNHPNYVKEKMKIAFPKKKINFEFYGSEVSLKKLNKILKNYNDNKIEKFLNENKMRINKLKKLTSKNDNYLIYENIYEEIIKI